MAEARTHLSHGPPAAPPVYTVLSSDDEEPQGGAMVGAPPHTPRGPAPKGAGGADEKPPPAKRPHKWSPESQVKRSRVPPNPLIDDVIASGNSSAFMRDGLNAAVELTGADISFRVNPVFVCNHHLLKKQMYMLAAYASGDTMYPRAKAGKYLLPPPGVRDRELDRHTTFFKEILSRMVKEDSSRCLHLVNFDGREGIPDEYKWRCGRDGLRSKLSASDNRFCQVTVNVLPVIRDLIKQTPGTPTQYLIAADLVNVFKMHELPPSEFGLKGDVVAYCGTLDAATIATLSPIHPAYEAAVASLTSAKVQPHLRVVVKWAIADPTETVVTQLLGDLDEAKRRSEIEREALTAAATIAAGGASALNSAALTRYHYLPIRDYTHFDSGTTARLAQTAQTWGDRDVVLMHCAASWGRTGNAMMVIVASGQPNPDQYALSPFAAQVHDAVQRSYADINDEMWDYFTKKRFKDIKSGGKALPPPNFELQAPPGAAKPGAGLVHVWV